MKYDYDELVPRLQLLMLFAAACTFIPFFGVIVTALIGTAMVVLTIVDIVQYFSS